MAGAVKIWNMALGKGAGTISCLVRWKGQYALLGVAHVLTPTWLGVSPTARPIVECGLGGATEIGMVRNTDPPVNSAGLPVRSSHDAALATIDVDTAARLVRQQNFLPSALRTTPIASGEPLFFTGAQSAATHTTVIQDHDAEAVFGYFVYALGQTVPIRTVDVLLRGLIQTDQTDEVDGGDSGSLLRDGQGRAIGILVGVDLVGSYCYFSPLESILDDFDASLVTQSDPLAKEIRVA